jgi:hypothetical protein
MSGNPGSVRDAILAVANEDYYGLYEVVWYLRSNGMADASEEELIDAGRKVVQSLLDGQLVRLVRFRMTPQDMQPIPAAEVAGVLQSIDSWRTPRSWSQHYPSLVGA